MKKTLTPFVTAAAVVGLVLTGCAPSSSEGGDAESTSADDASYPMTVTNCGREVIIEKKPENIVAFDGAAETLLALKASDQMAGYFGAQAEDLPADLGEESRKTEVLGSTFPFPKAEQVLENKPDLIVAYGFGTDGELGEKLDQAEIPYLNLSEACETDQDFTVDGYLNDVEMIADALGKPDEGKALVEKWQGELDGLTVEEGGGDKPSVVVSGNQDVKKPFISGSTSFVNDQISRAGGSNAYADEEKSYVSPSWEDVASRKPDIIVDGSGGGDAGTDDLRKFLEGNGALNQMPAVKNGNIVTVDYSENIPGPQAIEGIKKISEAINTARG